MLSQTITKDSFRAVPHRPRFAEKPRHACRECKDRGLYWDDEPSPGFYPCSCPAGDALEDADAEEARMRDQWANAIADAYAGGN